MIYEAQPGSASLELIANTIALLALGLSGAEFHE